MLAVSNAGGTRSRAAGRSVALVVTNGTSTGAVNRGLPIGRAPSCLGGVCSVGACELNRNRRLLGRDRGDLVSRFVQSRGEQLADRARPDDADPPRHGATPCS